MKTKHLIAILLCLCVAFSFSACSSMPYSSVDAKEYVKVGKYKGLKKKEFKVKVTDKEVNEQIKQILESNAETKRVKTGKVEKNDTVIIDYSGKINGKKFKNGSASDQYLTIGSNQFIKGFESGLVGVKIGAKKTLHLTFPKDYSEKKLAGKNVTFDVTVKSKQERVVPTLDENFVASQTKETKNKNVKTVKDYKAFIKKELAKAKKEQNVAEQKQALWNEVIRKTEMKTDKKGDAKYPEKEMKRVTKGLKKQYIDYAKQNNMSLKDFLKKQMNMDTKTFNKQIKAAAENQVKDDLTVCAIADKENISLSDDDYEKFVKKQLKMYGFASDKALKEQTGKTYEETVGEENAKMQALKQKVLDYIYKKAI